MANDKLNRCFAVFFFGKGAMLDCFSCMLDKKTVNL